jgi:hypothetical protein
MLHQTRASHVTRAAEDLRQPQMGCHSVSQDLFFFFFLFNNLYTGARRQTGLYLSTTRSGHSIECQSTEVKIRPEMSRRLPQIMRTIACATFPG